MADGGDVEVLEDLEEISARDAVPPGRGSAVIKLVNVVLMSAISKGASDIPSALEKEYRVFAIASTAFYYNIMAPPLKMRDAITSRIKIMAKLESPKSACRRTAASRPL